MIPRPAGAAAALLLPAAALAHSPIEGLDGFYAGLLHPLFVPAHLLPVLAFGILVGQQGVKRLQSAVIVFLCATAAGLGLAATVRLPIEVPLLTLAALLGGLVALGLRLPGWVLQLLAAVLGLTVGVDSAQDGVATGQQVGALLGTGVGVYLLVLYALAFGDYFSRREWQRVGLRVLGSWAAASALLVIALRLAG